MRLLLVIVLVFWFAGWTYGGYELTGQDFAWLDAQPAQTSGLKPQTFTLPSLTIPKLPTTKDEALKLYASLSPTQRDCMANVFTADQMAVIAKGNMPADISLAQKLSLAACLK